MAPKPTQGRVNAGADVPTAGLLLAGSVVVSGATAVVVYPWVSLWFQPYNARAWAPVYFPILFVTMPLAAAWVERRGWRLGQWLSLPFISWLIGTASLYMTWHEGYNWQRLPAWSPTNYLALIGDWSMGGVFMGMWFPGLAWVLFLWIVGRIRA